MAVKGSHSVCVKTDRKDYQRVDAMIQWVADVAQGNYKFTLHYATSLKHDSFVVDFIDPRDATLFKLTFA